LTQNALTKARGPVYLIDGIIADAHCRGMAGQSIASNVRPLWQGLAEGQSTFADAPTLPMGFD